jgi:predicted  nucleic acid-binding Zn-ribbon protein
MSEEMKQQCETQKKQIEQMGQQIQGAVAQIQSMKQMLGEQLDTIMILRTNLTLTQQAHSVVAQQLESNKKILAEHEKKVTDQMLEINRLKEELEPKVVDEIPAEPELSKVA